MKAFLLFFICLSAWAQTNPVAGFIPDFNFQVTDIATLGLNKEKLFRNMERKLINLETSICSNRAHLWSYDFKRKHNINSGKIFVFFTTGVWKKDEDGWMYHVAPYIVENGVEYIMEASYGDVSKPLQLKEWVKNETYGRVSGDKCVEITAKDKDLTEYFYERYNLPRNRTNGKPSAPCYIRKVPGYYAYPASIAAHDLKRDEDGEYVNFNPKSYDIDEVQAACEEAASSKVGRFFGGAGKKCADYLKR